MPKKLILCNIITHFKQKIIFTIALLSFLSLLPLQAKESMSAYAQVTRLTLTYKSAPIGEILKGIEKNSEFYFVYEDNTVPLEQLATVEAKDASIEDILNNLFSSTGNSYEILNRQIYIKKNSNPISSTPAPRQQMNLTIKGIVKDVNGEPLIGVNVTVKNNPSLGTITDLDGFYSLQVPANAVLVFSYVGFISQEKRVETESPVNIVLQVDHQSLDEVVVIGYGVQKKVNLTGSLAVVEAKALDARPVTNVSTALSGLASGVSVHQSSGRPGEDGATIRIRGQGTLNNNNALIIIDGIEGNMDDVNPNDIESMTILKDAASSAIYGARAGNGVILINTKKGLQGKPKVSFSAILSSTKASDMPSFVNDYPHYMELFNESLFNMDQPEKYSAEFIRKWREESANPNGISESGYPNYLIYPNTDWGEAIFERNWAQNYNLGISGGSESSKYNISFGYLDNPGIINNTGTERFQARANIETNIGKVLTFGTYTFLSLQKNTVANTDNATFNILRQLIPGIYPYKYDGYWGSTHSESGERQDVSFLRNFESSGGKDKTSRVNTTFFARVNILKGLTFETKFNYQTSIRDKNTYPLSSTTMSFDKGIIISEPQKPSEMQISYLNQKNYMKTFDNTLNYNFTLNKDHSFGILLGHNEYYFNVSEHSFQKKGLLDEGIYVPNSVGNMNNEISGKEADRGMRSFFGRFNYDYKSKYLFEFNLRYDGSSRFGSDTRWGTFPSISGGWRISEEAFMAPTRDWLNNLKIRASWGKLGNDAAGGTDNYSGNYDYQSVYGIARYSFGGVAYNALVQGKMPNPNLMWETTKVTNLGIDGTLFDSRATFEIDYYDKYTSGILTTPSIYLTVGSISPPTRNTADVRNRGLEMNLGWNDRVGEVSYGIRGNFSYNMNRVEKYKGKYETYADGSNNIGQVGQREDYGQGYVVEGHIINEYFLRELYSGSGTYFNTDGSVNIHGGPTDGMIRTPEDLRWVEAMKSAGYSFSPENNTGKDKLYYGDLIYADHNGDGVYGNENDRVFTGKSSLPKYNYGFNINLGWREWDLSMIWAGSAGMYYYKFDTGYNAPVVRNENAIGSKLAGDHYFYNEANPSDPRTNIHSSNPRLRNSDAINGEPSTRWLYKANFLKLRNLQIGYTIPSHLTKKVYIERARFYFSGENLLTITPFDFMDPEIGPGMGYPTMRQIAFGLNINF